MLALTSLSQSPAVTGKHARRRLAVATSSSVATAMLTSCTSFDCLPDELLGMVFTYLDRCDLKACYLVSQRVYKAARRLAVSDVALSFRKIKHLIKGLQKIEQLSRDKGPLKRLRLIQRPGQENHPDEIELYFELKAVCLRILPQTNAHSLMFINSPTSSVLDIVISSLPSLRRLYVNSFPRITFIHNPTQLLNLREIVLKVNYLPPSFHKPLLASHNLEHLSVTTTWLSPMHLYHFLQLPSCVQRLSVSSRLTHGHQRAPLPDFRKASILRLRVLSLRLSYGPLASFMSALQAFLDHIVTRTLLFVPSMIVPSLPRFPQAEEMFIGNTPTVHLDLVTGCRALSVSTSPMARPFSLAYQLTELTFHRCAMRNLHKLVVFTPNLKSLTLVSVETSDFAVANTLLLCPDLEKLAIIHCRGLTADLSYTISSRKLFLRVDTAFWCLLKRQLRAKCHGAHRCRVIVWRRASSEYLLWLEEADFMEWSISTEHLPAASRRYQSSSSIETVHFGDSTISDSTIWETNTSVDAEVDTDNYLGVDADIDGDADLDIELDGEMNASEDLEEEELPDLFGAEDGITDGHDSSNSSMSSLVEQEVELDYNDDTDFLDKEEEVHDDVDGRNDDDDDDDDDEENGDEEEEHEQEEHEDVLDLLNSNTETLQPNISTTTTTLTETILESSLLPTIPLTITNTNWDDHDIVIPYPVLSVHGSDTLSQETTISTQESYSSQPLPEEFSHFATEISDASCSPLFNYQDSLQETTTPYLDVVHVQHESSVNSHSDESDDNNEEEEDDEHEEAIYQGFHPNASCLLDEYGESHSHDEVFAEDDDEEEEELPEWTG